MLKKRYQDVNSALSHDETDWVQHQTDCIEGVADGELEISSIPASAQLGNCRKLQTLLHYAIVDSHGPGRLISRTSV